MHQLTAKFDNAAQDELSSINPKAINVVGLDQRLDPGAIARNDGGILRVKIGQGDLRIAEPAVLLAGDVAVVNWAIRMILGLDGYENISHCKSHGERTCSLNMYVDKSGVREVDITLLTTTSTIKYLHVLHQRVHSEHTRTVTHIPRR